MTRRPLFLERASFRRRRLGDAARVLPVLAALLVLVPVWWVPDQVSFAGGAALLFGLWALLIAAVAALHGALLRAEAANQSAAPSDEPSDADADKGPDDAV